MREPAPYGAATLIVVSARASLISKAPEPTATMIRKDRQSAAFPTGVGVGVAIGAAFGAAIGNLAIGVGVSIAFSLVLGMLLRVMRIMGDDNDA